MTIVAELRKAKAETIDAMKAMVDKAEAEKRNLTDEEKVTYGDFEKKLLDLNERIVRNEKIEALEAESRQTVTPPFVPAINPIGFAKNDEEFKSFGEFLYTIKYNTRDKRLQDIEYREQNMTAGNAGGFMVPPQFMTTLMAVQPQEAIFRPRATVLPAGSPPEASLTIPALDQTAARNMYGGVTVSWIAEGAAKPETQAYMREITLTPHEVAGHIVVTDKLLRNWEAAGTLIGTQLRNAILYAEETAFIGGTGAGQPQGITNSPAAININRAVASQIAIGDVDNMYRRILERGGRYVWVGSPTIKGQLLAMADAGSHRAWMPNQLGGIQGGMPATLYGIPLYFYERMPGLGSKGDLMLLDLSYYLIKDGAGPFVGVSEHVYFTSNKTVFKAFWSVDGQSWLNEPIAVEGSTTNTLSPFVVLDVP